jgi:hypothetical protein
MKALIPAALFLLAAVSADAQVLSTAETLGKGKSGLLVSDNVIVPGAGIPNLNIAYGEFARGLTDRVDLYLAAGETRTDGETQWWAGGGGNVRLARIRKLSVSFFSIATVPLTRHDEACRVLWNPALIVSVPLNTSLTIYSGVNALVPIGDRLRGVFTPPATKVNVPAGVTYAIGPWGLWTEVDIGPLKAVGVGLTRMF